MPYFIINTAVANIYKEASHNSAVLTQALMGESCQILDYGKEWYKIRQWDGYEGWMYYFYGVESKTKYQANMVLDDLFGIVTSTDKKKVISQLVFGANIQAEKGYAGYSIKLPDGRNGITANNFRNYPGSPTRKNIIKTATRFLGTPYKWGGKTPYGVDCSGFVQTVFQSNGISLPRDAYQQADFFTYDKIDEENLQTGDLIFFKENGRVTHVAISSGGRDFINARGFVQEESIDEQNPQFNRNLKTLFSHAISIKRIIG